MKNVKLAVPALMTALLACGGSRAGDSRQTTDESTSSPRKGYVLKADEGEKVVGGRITIKASPKTGSDRVAMFRQTLEPETQIPLHHHGRVDELFFVHEGTGTAVLGDERVSVGAGDVIFVPEGTDHKIENFGSRTNLELVFFVSAPGLDAMFREMTERMEKNPEPITLSELNEIAMRHGDLYKEARRR